MSMLSITAPDAARNVRPTADNDPGTLRGDIGPRHRAVPNRTATPPAAGELSQFLNRPCLELRMNADLEPPLRISNLADPSTFDAVLRRSRASLLEAASPQSDGKALMDAALRVLDQSVALRVHSNIVRNALRQG